MFHHKEAFMLPDSDLKRNHKSIKLLLCADAQSRIVVSGGAGLCTEHDLRGSSLLCAGASGFFFLLCAACTKPMYSVRTAHDNIDFPLDFNCVISGDG